jgi:hypothetical protein
MIFESVVSLMTEKQKIGIALAASLVVAAIGGWAPTRRMPIDFGAIFSISSPLAILWAGILVFSVWRFRWRGFSALVGAPMALYWPIWLVIHHPFVYGFATRQ